jgi:putative restriction endonuclease
MAQFGAVSGVQPGQWFRDRAALAEAGIHRPLQAGICGRASEGGAESIVLSGGYEDDEDAGNEIVYTGQGGNDPNTKRQVADQELTRGNKALYESVKTGKPVRVVRGSGHRSPHSPETGYSYAGLFQVVDAWHDRGRSGFRIWRYRLRRVEEAQAEAGDVRVAPPAGEASPGRVDTRISRVVRDSDVTDFVKTIYGNSCQVCGTVVETATGGYAEGAHIRPLGRPHLGPDVPANVLCLCPNHHVMFDRGGFSIDPATLSLVGLPGRLRVDPRHEIGTEFVRYHFSHYRPDA